MFKSNTFTIGKLKMKVFLCLFFLSLLLNLIFFIPDIYIDWRLFYNTNINENHQIPKNSIDEFLVDLIPSSIDYAKTGWVSQIPQPTRLRTTKERLSFLIKGNNHKLYSSAEEQYLNLALLEYGILIKDTLLINKIKQLFDNAVLPSELSITDQSISGCVANKLFELTKDVKYYKYSTYIYEFLKANDGEYGIVYHNAANGSRVTALGMIVPFLVSYSKLYKVYDSYKLAIKQINIYDKYGVGDNGVPAQAYMTKKPFLKIGAANWGRGCSFWLMALGSVNLKDLSYEAQTNISKLETILLDLWSADKKFGCMLGYSDEEDLSATLPILYYLSNRKMIELRESDLLYYSKYMHDGLLYNSNGPISGINGIGDYSGPNPLSQAYMIFLINKYISTYRIK